MRAALFLAMVFFLTAPLRADVVTNDSVVAMVHEGMADDVVVMAINQGEPHFDLGPDDLMTLKKEGVSDAVMKAMLKRQSETEQPATKPSTTAKSAGKQPELKLPADVSPEVGGQYYTRFSFHYEKGHYITTNYARGTLVPINTQVTLIALGDRDFVIHLKDTGEDVKVENVPKYTGKDADGIARMMLSKAPTNLDPLDDAMRRAIETGNLRLGMTKQEAILARGYPPVHRTPSTKADRWIYWNSRFVTQTIVFRDGVLAEGRGID